MNLREQWDTAKTDHSIIEEYDIDPYYVLQIINLLEPGFDNEGKQRAPSIKRGDILEMDVTQARIGWKPAIEGLASVLEILRDDCGVLIPSLIPYNTMIIPMAAVWSSQMKVKGAAAGANRIKLLRWFWSSAFGQQYENAPNSQAAKDFAELNRWMSGGEVPDSITSFQIDSLQLRRVGPRQRAIYRGVMALILQNGALDFHERGKITAGLIADKKNPVDDHHIFPQAFLNERNTLPVLRDCILNRTYIDRMTNRRLKARAPSDYFGEIRQEHGEKETDTLWRSHLMPAGKDSPLLSDEFDEFLKQRERVILKFITDKTGSK